MKLEIITPEEKLFEGDVNLIQLPGIDGSFEILNNHAPLISRLSAGKIKIINQSQEISFFEVDGGIIEVLKNKVVILAN